MGEWSDRRSGGARPSHRSTHIWTRPASAVLDPSICAGRRRELEIASRFGDAVAGIGDIDGDGIADLAVGGPSADFSLRGTVANWGEVWILLMNADAAS